MAKVLLQMRDENGVGNLPSVCMKCGADAVSHRPTTFSWHPQWISWVLALTLLAGAICVPIAIILRLVMTKRVRVEVPLCSRHQRPWLVSQIVMWGGLALLLVLATATVVAIVVASRKVGGMDALPIILLAVTAAYFPIWAVVASVVAQRAIHASLITPHEVRLVSVSRQFADAVYDDEDDAYRRRHREGSPRRAMPREDPDEGYSDRGGPR